VPVLVLVPVLVPGGSRSAVIPDEKGAVTEYTYSRLADVGADRVIERYGYEYKGSYMNIPATTTGDLWLSEAVPFGLVKDVMTMRDASGKTLTRIETVLVETGDGARTALPRWSWTGPAKGRAAPSRKPRR
jgi:hypothetical protein